MKKKFSFLIILYTLLFSMVQADSKKEGQVEIEVELEVIKGLSVEVTPMDFGDQIPGSTNIKITSSITVQGESDRYVLVEFIDKNNSSNEGFVDLINQNNNTKKQRVYLNLESSDDGILYITNDKVKDKIVGTIDKVVDFSGYYEGSAIVKVRYN